MWLFSRWIVRALAAPKFFDSYEAIGLVSTAVTLYALYMVLLVILGSTGRTEFNFPATAAALAVNVALNLILVPSLEIVGAGIALVVSYLVVIALMYGFTQRLFPVPYEWGRLARVLAVSVALVAIGELLLPTDGRRRPARADRRLARSTRRSCSRPGSSPTRSAAGSATSGTRSPWSAMFAAASREQPAVEGCDPRGGRGRSDGRRLTD